MAEEIATNGKDHDLLVELKTKVDRMIADLGDYNRGAVKAAADLQASKVDKDTFSRWEGDFCKDWNRELSNLKDTFVKELGDFKKTVLDNMKDHENRIRRLEKWSFIAIGALTLLQFVLAAVK